STCLLEGSDEKGSLANCSTGRANGRHDGWHGRRTSPRLKKTLFIAACSNNYVLQRHLHSHNCQWSVAQVLGAQPPSKDRCEQRRSREECARTCRRRYGG